MQEDRMNSRDFEIGKEDTLLEYIRMCLSDGKQFAVTPLPESDSPKYGILPEDAERRKKWREGWRAEDAQRSKKK